ncbi:hypothetical protein [Paracoccus thiocyanatus]|nr:hypothetical protein [Paracoccus thiocyanatus]
MTMKRAAVLALALAAGSAHADGANLRAALSVLPDTVFSAASPDVARYLDLSALAARHGGVLGPEALTRATLGGGIRPIEAMALATPQDFAAKAGIDSAALSFVAGLGRLPAAVSIWGFADDDAAAAAYSGLSAQGFSRLGLLPGMLANGEPNVTDIGARDPANPWRGQLGQASVVARSGPTLLQAGDRAALAPVKGASAPALETPAGQTLLAALEAQQGAVLQAAFLGPYHGLGGIDPAILVGKTPDEAREALERAAAKANGGLPPWQGAALADLEATDGPALILALAYADCPTAQAAAARAAALWQTMDPPPAGAAKAGHVETPSGCAAVLRAAGTDEPKGPFAQAVFALMSGNLPPLRIGQ